MFFFNKICVCFFLFFYSGLSFFSFVIICCIVSVSSFPFSMFFSLYFFVFSSSSPMNSA